MQLTTSSMCECSIGTCNTAGTVGAGGMSPFFWSFFFGGVRWKGNWKKVKKAEGRGGREVSWISHMIYWREM